MGPTKRSRVEHYCQCEDCSSLRQPNHAIKPYDYPHYRPQSPPLQQYISDKNIDNKTEVYDQLLTAFGLKSTTISNNFSIHKLYNDSESAKIIREYFDNSNPHNIKIRIVKIWRVTNLDQYKKFIDKNYAHVENWLLWHGTKRTNFISILQNNLRLPVHITNGSMFGKGIYFADRMSKSAGYTDQSGPVLLFLCKVALGSSRHRIVRQDFCSPTNTQSREAIGRNIPDKCGERIFEDCIVPCGGTVANPDQTPSLHHNEYIVFDQDRVQIMFILQCERYNQPIPRWDIPIPRRYIPIISSQQIKTITAISNHEFHQLFQKYILKLKSSNNIREQMEIIKNFLNDKALMEKFKRRIDPQMQTQPVYCFELKSYNIIVKTIGPKFRWTITSINTDLTQQKPYMFSATIKVFDNQNFHQLGSMDNLPMGWVTKLSRRTGRIYFYNVTTKWSQWDRPIAGAKRKHNICYYLKGYNTQCSNLFVKDL